MTLEQDIVLFKNKVAVITGGSGGIGFAVSSALVDRGVKVVIGDVLKKEGQEAVDNLNKRVGKVVAIFQYCDVRYYNDLKKLFNVAETKFGGVDIAILNAGLGFTPGSALEVMDDESERLIFDVNIGGVVKGNKVAMMHLVKRQGGVIINTASIAGVTTTVGMGAYSATKHAVVGWTRALDHLQVLGIRVNAVCPSWTDTNIIKLPKDADGNPHDFSAVLDACPLVPMEKVVNAFLDCIRNEEHVGT
ncbi:uncharacterized protein BX664DRAFT_328234 [Halteromyces radiatus]|uniref:uncharacterized protein n=1 Tax=Halteromyces radiatus TaxID=101107 RepID=UPI00222014AF|nr:uncharacterized protein BX664DRAFT_328234 [Halteromyces radiatus]KAI8092823.1 hypothetical protein BX664DRAFT_328234 [Halteromyces radiatus]